jgi:methionyl-tRNA formyltransferase
MRIVFAGTPEFAVAALDALVAAGHDIAAVLTQPDRAAGRGLAPAASAVKARALEHGVTVMQPLTLRAQECQTQLRALYPDAMVVVAYGLILPQAVLDIPRHGALNIHASLLPRWRGAAPIQRALLAGDRETGISIMQMDAGLDTGPVLMRSVVPILPHDTAETLHDKLAGVGAALIVETLHALERSALSAIPQSTEGASYAPKIEKSEALIDWRNDAQVIERQIRAFNPYPGAGARLRGTDIKIWRAATAPGTAAHAGEVLATDAAVTVACGRGALRLEELQRAGGRRLPAFEFLRGFPVAVGDRFGD